MHRLTQPGLGRQDGLRATPPRCGYWGFGILLFCSPGFGMSPVVFVIFASPGASPPPQEVFPRIRAEYVHVHAAHRNKCPIPERPESRIIIILVDFFSSLSLYTSRHASHSHAQSHIRSFALCCPTQSIPWSFLISHRMPLAPKWSNCSLAIKASSLSSSLWLDISAR